MRAHELDLGLVVNILKGAIATSDRVLTVSEGYANEITTPLGGKGLEAMLEERVHRLDGVVNGIDMDEWNPANDPHEPLAVRRVGSRWEDGVQARACRGRWGWRCATTCL